MTPFDTELPEQDRPVRGSVIGRYTVLERAGRGGMGEVYAAFDEELDRKVALKLLHAREGIDDERARARLLREARAMARLSHPNAVSIHDVGTYGARVFIAMEFVEGLTLNEWLAAQPRSRAEILEVFFAAARGLAAAHAAGLVHRDFKPQNLMIARDGIVRVMDFGLARAVDAPGDETATAGSAPPEEKPPRELDLTKTGELFGTPAYMAPEQFSVGTTDARADQFSFCVTLYEALYGQRPFASEPSGGLVLGAATGPIREPPPGTHVPAWMRRVLLRGLEREAPLRFPSIEALVYALAADPTRRRRRVAQATAGVLCVVGVVLGAQRLVGTRSSLCRGGAQKLVGIWEPAGAGAARKEGIRATFAATGKKYASQAYAGAASLLDEYVARWLHAYRDTCEATQVRGEQSAEVLDLRMTCLQGRLANVRALTEVMTRADGQTVENAVAAAGALPSLDRCGDVALLKAVVQPPLDPQTRGRVELLRAEGARLGALRDSGHCHEAMTTATELLNKVRETGYLPLLAQTLTGASLLTNDCASLPQALRWLREAYVVAVEAHDDEVAAESATLAGGFLAVRGHHPEDARQWLEIGRASLRRIEARPLLQAWWFLSEGSVLIDEGRPADAVTAFRSSLELKRKILGDNHLDVVRSMNNLGQGLQAAGRLDEALASFTAAANAAERILGPEHPFVGQPWNNMGEALNLLGRHAQARAAFERSLEILRRGGSDAELVAYPLTGLGLAELGEGQPQKALTPLEEALRARTAHPESPTLLGEVRFALARALWSRTVDHARAMALARAARENYAGDRTAQAPLAAIDGWITAREKVATR